MPRRSVASAGPSTQIKKEPARARVKKERVKKEKVNGKRRAQTPEDTSEPSEDLPDEEREEENGAQQNSADEDHHAREDESPRTNKRRRVNGRGESAVDDSGSKAEPALRKIKTLPRGANG